MAERIAKTEIVKNKITKAIIKGKYSCGEALPSIEQLAKQFCVSKNTVSLVLAELARSEALEMAHGKSTRVTEKLSKPHIMIYTPRPYNMETHPFFGEFYRGVNDTLLKAEDITKKLYTEVQLFQTEKMLRPLPERLDGIILMDFPSLSKMNLLLRATGKIPVVSIYENCAGYERSFPGILSDFSSAMRELIKEFHASGVRRCAYAGFFGSSEKIRIGTNHNKFYIFRTIAAEYGIEIPDDLIVKTMPNIQGGVSAMQQILESKSSRPDAVFLTSDLMAPGVYKVCREKGVRIPEDILIAGCDNMEISDYLYPTLTTIDLNAYRIGVEAAEQMLACIRTGCVIESKNFPTGLIRRESTLKTLNK